MYPIQVNKHGSRVLEF
uniref:Uncharacterized protein n=1 Tax=Rhizophora mucronata TaxID=61149 RepID=A0A2P2QCA7_RHIMU